MKYIDLNTRKEIIRLYQKHKYTEKEIADILNITPFRVHYWIQRYDSNENIDIKHKSGRPRITTNAMDQKIFEKSNEEPFFPATDIQKLLNIPCGAQTVRNRLKEKGLKNRIPARKDFLKDIHKQKRLHFAANHLDWSISDWNRVVFSDEKIFCSWGFGPLKVWRPLISDRYDKKYTSYHKKRNTGRFSIAVWACISGTGHNFIHLIERPTLNADYYIEHILEPVIGEYFKEDDIIFMHDLSPIHKSQKVSEWIDTNGITIIEDWPPKGPDMNPIENLWGEIERVLQNRGPQMKDKNDLWLSVSQVFEDLTETRENYIRNLIGSMPKRVSGVFSREGGWIKY